MARQKRIVGLPGNETASGHFNVEEVEDGIVVEPELQEESVAPATGIKIIYHERSATFRSGKEVLVAGGRKSRYFSPETHGKEWRAKAIEFMESCNESERRNKLSPEDAEFSREIRPRFISMEEI